MNTSAGSRIDAGADWSPGAGVAPLRLRARVRDRIRAFFASRDSLEVDTPIAVSTVPAEAAIAPVSATVNGRRCYLRTSPEAAMKRLLAAGVGDCWQLGPVFRDGELGDHHQPEFHLLEWYRQGWDQHALMDEVEALVGAALQGDRSVPAAHRMSWQQGFKAVLGCDPLTVAAEDLGAAARRHGVAEVTGLAADDRAGWLDWLLAGVVVPRLSVEAPLFLYDWPVEQAALARPSAHDTRLAERFELYWQGVELANGFRELADSAEQRRRLIAEQAALRARGVAPPPLDERLLAALEAGLPDSAGVALGFDRLVMLAAGADNIGAVTAFAFARA